MDFIFFLALYLGGLGDYGFDLFRIDGHLWSRSLLGFRVTRLQKDWWIVEVNFLYLAFSHSFGDTRPFRVNPDGPDEKASFPPF